MSRETSLALVAVAAALFSSACTQNAQPVVLRSLEASGRFSSLCLGTRNPTATIPLWEPRNLNDCPDTSRADGEQRDAFAMVTQTTRGEVALVNLTLGSVNDAEPTIPGYNFLPIGGQPTAIVSTPGSLATFVGVAEVGKEGIFALPTSCVGGRTTNAPLRDLTTWPACRLPSAPAEIALIIDAPPGTSQPDLYRQHCGEMPSKAALDPAQQGVECPADLSTETQSPGRRKLVVSLPERRELVVIDAQDLLDRAPGTYEPCVFEQQLPIHGQELLTGMASEVQAPDQSGMANSKGNPALAATAGPELAGFAQVEEPATNEHRLFVADRALPMIHDVDTSDVCALVEDTSPLRPLSASNPGRTVTTNRIAASPLTVPPVGHPASEGKRYLYAIDEIDNGSIMIFDVSSGSTVKTPLQRSHASLLPSEPSDRIAFTAPARDLTFVRRDHVQVDPVTGSQQIGQLCNPDPTIPATDPGAHYRPSSDLSTGASPSFLRGLFGFAALQSGHVAVIDIQDFDEPCRRPITANPKAVEDFRGCSNDTVPKGAGGPFFATSAGPTVTNEVTCKAVEPHRVRSAAAIRNDLTLGTHAPSLRAFPTLVSDTGRTLPTNGTADGLKNPRMLGVDFSATDKAQVWLGTTLFAAGDRNNPLEIDPAKAQSTSLVLSFREPRIYQPQENFTAVYEGVVAAPRLAGVLAPIAGGLTLTDTGAQFCNAGVEDVPLARQRAEDYGVAQKDYDRFAQQHADYVEITSDLLPSDTDKYWTKPFQGATCGGANANAPGAGFLRCQTAFGTSTVPSTRREFRIRAASPTTLDLVPRDTTDAAEVEKLTQLTMCCFPTAISYEVRASNEWVVRGSVSGFRHDIETRADGQACIISPDPQKSRLYSRVIEVSCEGNGCAPNAVGPTIGPANGSVGCVVASSLEPTLPADDDHKHKCIFNGLSGAFVIYRGTQPTLKNYEFDWTVVGGFSPLLVNLSATTDTNTSPLSMVYSEPRGALLVADGSTKGVITVDLATLGINVIY